MPEATTGPKEVRLKKLNGALLEAPIWESHQRGSNWAAVIGVDPAMPGGLERRFVDRGRGVCLFLSEQIALFDAMEFAADYYTYVREKRPNRWYGVVVSVEADSITLREFPSGLKAILAAKELREKAAAAAQAAKAEMEKRDAESKVEERASAVEAQGGAGEVGERGDTPPGEGRLAEEAPKG